MYLEEQKNLQNSKLHIMFFFYSLQFLNKNNVKEEITEFLPKNLEFIWQSNIKLIVIV
jgi:hypothetical protein